MEKVEEDFVVVEPALCSTKPVKNESKASKMDADDDLEALSLLQRVSFFFATLVNF